MRALNLSRLLLALVSSTLLSGCNTYWERKETVLLSSGDAVASNIVTQVSDPWPRASRNTTIVTNGERAETGFIKYKAGGPSVGSPASPAPGTAGTAGPSIPQ